MQNLPTWVEIDLDALTHNLERIRSRLDSGVRLMLTVKADAYGHGAVEVAHAAEPSVDCFGVATLDEALELKSAGVRHRVLIVSPILSQEIPPVVDNGFEVTVSSVDRVREISKCAVGCDKVATVHIEVDTGMGRTGVWPLQVQDLTAEVDALPGVHLGGLLTHFPVSDIDAGFTKQQIRAFRTLAVKLAETRGALPLLHSANSAAIGTLSESHMQMVRPGLLVYGYLPKGASGDVDTVPVLTWKCRLVQVRSMPAGASISYGRTFVAPRAITMGVLPVGYGHGYPWRLSGRGEVLIGGCRAPILGRVTMDMTMVDLTDLPNPVRAGEEVVLAGSQGGAWIGVDELADRAGTISYEIMCGISKRVPRIYFRGGKVETIKSLLGVNSPGRRPA